MIPKEIDELMWTIAEGNDPGAIEEFGNRYPNLREEMLKRMKTITALKSGNRLPRSTPVPTFQNPHVRPANWKWIGASFAVTILAVTAFGIWKSIPRASSLPTVNPVNVESATFPGDSGVVYTNNEPKVKETLPVDEPNNGTLPLAQPGSEAPKPQSLKSMKIESAPLQVAIQLIATEGQLTVTISPGLANPTIKVDFQNMAPLDMLKALGEQYAFTTILDGDHAIIIIPKKDEDEGQITSENR